MPRNVLIEFRRDTAANWTSADPTLASGEPGFETDTGKIKIGDGTTAWTSLSYYSGPANTLAEVLAAGNDAGNGTTFEATAPTVTALRAADGAATADGQSLSFPAGWGDGGSVDGALVGVWAGKGDGTKGRVEIYTDGTDGAVGAVLTSDGTYATWQAVTGTLNFVVDGGGSTVTTGIKGDVVMPFAGEFTQVTLLADQSGDIEIDIWNQTYGSYPPTVTESIVAAAPPTITTAIKSQDSTLSGWTTAFAAGDILRFSVTSVTSITRATLALDYTKQ